MKMPATQKNHSDSYSSYNQTMFYDTSTFGSINGSCDSWSNSSSCRDCQLQYSSACLDATAAVDCYPYNAGLSIFAGIWCIINCVCGSTGNLLTLLAIPYANRNRKFGLKYDCTHIFVLNLVFSDLLYCTLNLPPYALQYLSNGWPLSEELCYITASFRYINAFADWMSLAFIALSQCVNLVQPELGRRLFSGRGGFLAILGIWTYSLLLQIPIYFESLGTFGYNCLNGKCDILPPADNPAANPYAHYAVMYGIAFTLPCIIIVVSYGVIIYKVRLSSETLRRNSIHMTKRLNSRDWRLTKMVMLISSMYVVFVLPISVCNMVDSQVNYPQVQLACFCLYWMQYSLNFFVYAFRSGPYRRAYMYFYKSVNRTLRSCCCWCKPTKNQPSFTITVTTDRGRVMNSPVLEENSYFSHQTVVISSNQMQRQWWRVSSGSEQSHSGDSWV